MVLLSAAAGRALTLVQMESHVRLLSSVEGLSQPIVEVSRPPTGLRHTLWTHSVNGSFRCQNPARPSSSPLTLQSTDSLTTLRLHVRGTGWSFLMERRTVLHLSVDSVIRFCHQLWLPQPMWLESSLMLGHFTDLSVVDSELHICQWTKPRFYMNRTGLCKYA